MTGRNNNTKADKTQD